MTPSPIPPDAYENLNDIHEPCTPTSQSTSSPPCTPPTCNVNTSASPTVCVPQDLHSTSTVTFLSGIHSPLSSSCGIDSGNPRINHHLLSSSSTTTTNTTSTTANSSLEEDVQSPSNSRRGGLPRCAVVNFHKEGDTLRWAPRVSHNVSGVPARVHNFEDAFTLEEFSSAALPVLWHATGGNPRVLNLGSGRPLSSYPTRGDGISGMNARNGMGIGKDPTNPRLVVKYSRNSVPLATNANTVGYNQTERETGTEAAMLSATETRVSRVLGSKKENSHQVKNIQKQEMGTRPAVRKEQSEGHRQSMWSVLIHGNRNTGNGRMRNGGARRVGGRRRRSTVNKNGEISDGEDEGIESELRKKEVNEREGASGATSISTMVPERRVELSTASSGGGVSSKRGVQLSNEGHVTGRGRRRLLGNWNGSNGDRRRSRLGSGGGSSEAIVIKNGVESGGCERKQQATVVVEEKSRHSDYTKMTRRVLQERQQHRHGHEAVEDKRERREVREAGGERQGGKMGDRAIRQHEHGRAARLSAKGMQAAGQQESKQEGADGGGGRMMDMISGRRSRSSLGDGVLRRKLSRGNSKVEENDDQYLSFMTSVM